MGRGYCFGIRRGLRRLVGLLQGIDLVGGGTNFCKFLNLGVFGMLLWVCKY